MTWKGPRASPEGTASTTKEDGAWEIAIRRRIEHPDIADVYNTVLKMAKKRAHIDAILTATAASDIFTQDVEDLLPAGTEQSELPGIDDRTYVEASSGEKTPRGGRGRKDAQTLSHGRGTLQEGEPPGATPVQQLALQCREAGLGDRAAALRILSHITGRQIKQRDDLRPEEISTCTAVVGQAYTCTGRDAARTRGFLTWCVSRREPIADPAQVEAAYGRHQASA